MRILMLLAMLLVPCLARSQPLTGGPAPGNGYGVGADAYGVPYFHLRTVDPQLGQMSYASVTVGTTSTQVLAAAPSVRFKLYMVNPSGRLSGTTLTDCWCAYGVPAVLGQGFMLAGYGDRVTEDVLAMIDPRAINCIASAPVVINVGDIHQ